MTYDLSRDKAHKPGNSLSLRRSYQKRKILMRDGISFSKGTTRKEKEVIALIIDMFRGKRPHSTHVHYYNHNLDANRY